MLKHRHLLAAVIAALALSGCTQLRAVGQKIVDGGPAGLAFQVATMKYIESAGDQEAQQDRAAAVRSFAERVREQVKGQVVSVEDLRAYALSQLPPDLAPSDRLLAGILINSAADSLEARLGADSADAVKPDDQVAIGKVLDLVEYVASLYG